MSVKLNAPEASVIGIAMATYNPDFNFFQQQIDSLKKQSVSNWICVIVDDGSTDETFQKIHSLTADDKRLSVIKNSKNLGSFKTFEVAIKSLPPSAELICLCDQDDIWTEHKLEKMRAEFLDPEVNLVHSDLTLIDPHEKILAPSCWAVEGRYVPSPKMDLLLFRNTITGCATMFRSRVLQTALPFPQHPVRYHHDLWIGLHAKLDGQIKALGEPLVLYRQHGRNLVGAGGSGHGAELSTLSARAGRVYEERLQIRADFLQSLQKINPQKFCQVQSQLDYVLSFPRLLIRGLYFCSRNPKFYKVLALLLVGFTRLNLTNFAKRWIGIFRG